MQLILLQCFNEYLPFSNLPPVLPRVRSYTVSNSTFALLPNSSPHPYLTLPVDAEIVGLLPKFSISSS